VETDGFNFWNTTKTLGTNIIGGPYIGGNYWSDYKGVDTSNPQDGIGDTLVPYTSNGNIRNRGDYLPLTTVNIVTPPNITILSPKNATTYTLYSWYYGMDILPLNFMLNKPPFWIGYSLDGASNKTITGNTSLTALKSGSHNLKLYANDSYGKMGYSEVYFTTIIKSTCIRGGRYPICWV